MKVNIHQLFANLFMKHIGVETYKRQLQEFWMEYKDLWLGALSDFRKEYQENHGSIFDKAFLAAEDEFERELRKKNDVLSRFYEFMDKYYVVYINANPKEREEIRDLVRKQGNLGYHFEDLIMKYVREWVIQQLKLTGKKVWLLRGLVAMSIENSGIDYRDTLASLAELYAAAEVKGINPKNDFQQISDISSDEMPAGGSTPMKKLMADIYSSAILAEQKSQRK